MSSRFSFKIIKKFSLKAEDFKSNGEVFSTRNNFVDKLRHMFKVTLL